MEIGRAYKRGRPSPITPEIVLVMKNLRGNSNMSYSEVAKALGVTRDVVRYHLNKKCPTDAAGGADQPDNQANPKTLDITREAV